MKPLLRAGRTIPIVLIVCVLVSAAAGVGIGLFLTKKASASAEAEGGHERKRNKDVEPKTIYSLEEMIVNLADTDTLRYAKFTVAIGFEEKVGEEVLKELRPALRDAVLGVVSNKKFSELHRPDGLPKVKEEIRHVVEERFHKLLVAQVYFEGFAMQ